MTLHDGHRPPRRLAMLAVPVAAAGLVTGLTACAPQRLKGGCGIVVDGSGSSKATTGFNAQDQLNKNVDGFLTKAECRTVVFAPITVSSNTPRCNSAPLDMDPDEIGSADRENVWASYRAKALKQAQDLLRCLYADQTAQGGSDVLGGLSSIARKRPSGVSSYDVLVVSDFMHTDGDLNLYKGDAVDTALKRERVIDGLMDAGRVPDLSAVRLTTAGYGMLQSRDPRRFGSFDAFWRSVLKDHAKCQDLTLQ